MATRKRSEPSKTSRAIGRFVRRLRHTRGLTQERLAEDSGLSADTIRRLEMGTFSPSLDSLVKLSKGLRIDLGSMFTAFDLGEIGIHRELVGMARTLTPREVSIAIRVLTVLVEMIAGVEGSEDG